MSKNNRMPGVDIRFDRDFGGNHIQLERDKASAIKEYAFDASMRLCDRCGCRKKKKGGKGMPWSFVCLDCQSKP